MDVDCALLCDAVTVREGLLHVLGGGATRLVRNEWPAKVGVALAVRLLLHPTEIRPIHELRCDLVDEDGHPIGQLTMSMELSDIHDTFPGQDYSVPIGLPVGELQIPRAGAYSFEIFVDATHTSSVGFVAAEDPFSIP